VRFDQKQYALQVAHGRSPPTAYHPESGPNWPLVARVARFDGPHEFPIRIIVFRFIV
jgi:hypothetical protein